MSKFDKGKYKPSLIYTSLLKAISKVREYGIAKYGSGEDWLTTPKIKHIDAGIRHLRAFSDGESIDKESGLHHLYHAASNIMFEIERLERKKDTRKKPTVQMLNLGDFLNRDHK